LQVNACPAGADRHDGTWVQGQKPPQAGWYQGQEHHHLNSVSLYPPKMLNVA
jgi:hypothetical protein